MSKENSKRIRDLLKGIVADTKDELYSRLCIAHSIDKEKNVCDCSPIDSIGGADFEGVRLSPTQGSDNVVYPKEGSTVIISFLNSENAYISSVNVTDKHKIAVSDDEGEFITSQKKILKEQNLALKTFAESIIEAINVATFKHPYGPTIAEPINKTQFDDSLSTFTDELERIDGEIDELYEE